MPEEERGELDLSKVVLPREEIDEKAARRAIEALLFASAEPVNSSVLARAVGGISGRLARKLVEELRREYDEEGRAFEVVEIAGGFQLLTRAGFIEQIRRLKKVKDSTRLSPAALESLAIVAYKQPVTRAEVEAIRGVGSEGVLRSLMEMKLIKVVGRAKELGAPLLYGTTREFLDRFGLARAEDLPKPAEGADERSSGPYADRS